jgi:NADPH:quinone reductase-like Zn-dependent oxidoreductase
MDAWVLDESPGTYRWGTVGDPLPGRDEVQVRVVASALNQMDLWVTKGMPKPPLPHVPGCDVAGVVDAVGEEVTNVAVGDEVVINPGVSNAALALARAMGASVVVTSRNEAKRAQALKLGADAAFDSADSRWPVEADVVVESVGPATWEQSVRALKAGGRLVVCGGTSGPKVELNLPRLFFKQIEIIGSTMGSYEEFASLTNLVARGLPVQVDGVFDLIDYPMALERLERGEQLGKIVLHHPVR